MSIESFPLSPRNSSLTIKERNNEVSIQEIQSLFRRKSLSDMYEKNKRGKRSSTAPPHVSREAKEGIEPIQIYDVNTLQEYYSNVKGIEPEMFIKVKLASRTALCLPSPQPSISKEIASPVLQKKERKKKKKRRSIILKEMDDGGSIDTEETLTSEIPSDSESSFVSQTTFDSTFSEPLSKIRTTNN